MDIKTAKQLEGMGGCWFPIAHAIARKTERAPPAGGRSCTIYQDGEKSRDKKDIS